MRFFTSTRAEMVIDVGLVFFLGNNGELGREDWKKEIPIQSTTRVD